MRKSEELEPYEIEFLKLLAKGVRIAAEKREQERTEARNLDEKSNLKEHVEDNIVQKPKNNLSRAELPNYLTARNIHQFTNIKLRTVYDLMNKSPERGGIPDVFKIGKPLYAPRESFLSWWDETKERGRK
ncbi:hypothetical protein [Paenibacillus lautus]|uniref:hypothetical protein n=1 Tax=Paenibacillus lautus TaxID=1401 RepID=UPI003D2E9179